MRFPASFLGFVFTILAIFQFASPASSQEEIAVEFLSGNLTLYGTLSVPDGEGPFPAVILIHGSGPNDRDQTIHLTGGNVLCLYPGLYNDTLRNFRDLAMAFQAEGVAVLRYDKRTFTYGNQLDPKEISPYDFIADAHAAIDFLHSRVEVDPGQIHLLGHSQGGNFIPIIAGQRDDIASIVALAAASGGIDTIIAGQFRELYYRCLMDTAQGNAFFNQVTSDFQKMRRGNWDPNQTYLGAYPKFWLDWMDITDSTIIQFSNISIPTLFLQGSIDFNVPPENGLEFEQELSRDSVDVYFLEGINHFFTNSTEKHVAQMVPDTILFWWQKNQSTTTTADIFTELNPIQVYYRGNSVSMKIQADQLNIPYTIIDMQGRALGEYTVNGGELIEVPMHTFSEGYYFVSTFINGKTYTEKILFLR